MKYLGTAGMKYLGTAEYRAVCM